jgi:hypothetical protein
MMYRLAWALAALPAFAAEVAAASGSTAVSSTVCMSFPVALLLALMPAESLVTIAQQKAGIKKNGNHR